MTENWKPVAGFEGYYEVSDLGNVRSLDRPYIDSLGRKRVRLGRELKPWAGTGGRLRVDLWKDGQVSKRQVHRLVLEAFEGSCPPGHECCHWDDDPTNNRLSNLRWDSPSANNLDMVRNGNHRNARKTECKWGHKFDVENTYITTDGRRMCRECLRARNLACKAQKNASSHQGHLTGRKTA